MKKKLYIYEDVSDVGNDFLRRALGTVWSKVSSSGDTTGYAGGRIYGKQYDFEYNNDTNLEVPSVTTKDMRDIDALSAEVNAPEEKYHIFKKIEINPARIVKINDKTPIPNFKIPVRIYADPDLAKSDIHWSTIFMGGTIGDVVYPRLADQETIFYDMAFELEIHETWKTTQALLAAGFTDFFYPGGYGNVKIVPEYNNYDQYIDNYQRWAKDKHELLLPNLNFEINYRADAEDFSELAEVDEDPTAPYPEPMWKLRKIRASEKPYLSLLNYHFPVELGAERAYFSEASENNRWFGDSWIYNWKPSAELKNDVIRHQKNIIFDNSYFTKFNEYRSLIDNSTKIANSPNMFNISIEFAKHVDLNERYTSPPRYANKRRIETSPNRRKNALYTLRNSIADRGFDSKFLETLKDLDAGNLDDFKMEKMNFKVQTDSAMLDNSLEDPGLIRTKKTDSIKLESFNFIDFLMHAYNNPEAAVNDDYTFMGPTHDGRHASTYENSSIHRYSNNSDLLSVIDDTIKDLQVYFTKLLLKSDLDPDTGAGYSDIQEHVYENLLNAETHWTEVLAYKVEKHGGDRTGDSQTSSHLQNFWCFNYKLARTVDGPYDSIEIKDSQVKYGKEYTYKGYAYVAVISHKYKYTDFRLTKQTNNYDTDDDGEIDKYCIQFYEPLSQEIAPQIFAISNAPERNPSGEEYSNLSEYNTFAPSQYDISESPQLADFYLNIEPCIKIVKLPIFEKRVGVYDNPDSKLSSVPFYVIDDSNKIGFNSIKDSFKEDTYPSVVTDEDAILKEKYLNSQGLYANQLVKISPEAPARYLEVFRTKKKPTSYTDFKDNLVSKIDLRIPGEVYNRTDYNLFDKIASNTKYYYLMRTVTENGMPGHPSVIVEAELVSDGGYKYAKFDTVDTSDFTGSDLTKKTTSFKKLFQLEPNTEQLFLDTTEADFEKNANTQINNVRISRATPSLFDKKFKIRLTSKKTGKKTDLNVTFNIQEKDFS